MHKSGSLPSEDNLMDFVSHAKNHYIQAKKTETKKKQKMLKNRGHFEVFYFDFSSYWWCKIAKRFKKYFYFYIT